MVTSVARPVTWNAFNICCLPEARACGGPSNGSAWNLQRHTRQSSHTKMETATNFAEMERQCPCREHYLHSRIKLRLPAEQEPLDPPHDQRQRIEVRPLRHRLRLALGGTLAKPLLDITLDDLLELGGDVGAAQGHGLFAIDEDGRCRLFAGAGQRDADIGVL